MTALFTDWVELFLLQSREQERSIPGRSVLHMFTGGCSRGSDSLVVLRYL